MNDYLYLQEIDDDDVKLRLFAHSLTGEVKNGLKHCQLPLSQISHNFTKLSSEDGK